MVPPLTVFALVPRLTGSRGVFVGAVMAKAPPVMVTVALVRVAEAESTEPSANAAIAAAGSR
jgi:hypothetical protein